MDVTDDRRPECVRRLEEKHGLPITKIPGMIYGLCYDPPCVVESVSMDYAGDPPEHNGRGYLSACPIRHYVSRTQQKDPNRRILNHHSAGTCRHGHAGARHDGARGRGQTDGDLPDLRPTVCRVPDSVTSGSWNG
jgi:hypothetical protein